MRSVLNISVLTGIWKPESTSLSMIRVPSALDSPALTLGPDLPHEPPFAPAAFGVSLAGCAFSAMV